MTKDYTVIRKEKLTVLGHKVMAVTEIFSDEYLNSNRFVPRCLRCCFSKNYRDTYNFCNYIKCNGGRGDVATHFELVDENKSK